MYHHITIHSSNLNTILKDNRQYGILFDDPGVVKGIGGSPATKDYVAALVQGSPDGCLGSVHFILHFVLPVS